MEMGAIRCLYICAKVEEISTNSKDLATQSSADFVWELYPAFIEYLYEYMCYLDSRVAATLDIH